ncbi:hypothetical protein H5T51_07695 [Candidatus Bathyarchaeota archaeon]|nr:hypothetical protein [Candidatus Bathyarchaeota archaeon]
MKGKGKRRNSSGQLMIVTALAIAVLIVSTTVYVYENTRVMEPLEDPLIGLFIESVKQSSKNAVISALANVSNGGTSSIFTENIEQLAQAYLNLKSREMYHLQYTLREDAKYSSGFWIFWGNSGFGVSSAYANFTLKVYGLASKINIAYAINVTTAIMLEGYYSLIETGKNVTLTCRVFNEDAAGLAQQIFIYYRNTTGTWEPVNAGSLSQKDYGNGTYVFSFIAPSDLEPVDASAHVLDTRGIYVRANVTCHEA